jgi:hypothetical protein
MSEEFKIGSRPGTLTFWGPTPAQQPVMTIRFDTEPVRIEVAEGVVVDEAAKAVIDALRGYIEQGVQMAVAERLRQLRTS